MHKLTVKQQRILDIIINFISKVGYPPSYREIGELANLASASTVQEYLVKLKNKGYITWEPGLPRTLAVIKHNETAS